MLTFGNHTSAPGNAGVRLGKHSSCARRKLNWPRACLAATFYVIALLLACQDMTRGGRLLGAAVLLGAALFGALLAGLLVGVSGDLKEDVSLFPSNVQLVWARCSAASSKAHRSL